MMLLMAMGWQLYFRPGCGLFIRSDRIDSIRWAKMSLAKKDGIKAMEDFLESIGMRLRLRDLGCKLEDAQIIAELAIKTSPYLSVHPTPMDSNAVAKIYRDSF